MNKPLSPINLITRHNFFNVDYGKMKKMAHVGHATESRFFEIYIQPLFKVKPVHNLPFWMNAAYIAWRLDIKAADLQKVKFVESQCEQLFKTNEAFFIQAFPPILQTSHDTSVRTEQAEENLWHSKGSKDVERIFSDQIRLYKIFFENEFRLWSTAPYLFACKNHGVKNKLRDPEKAVLVGASEKFHALKGIKTVLPQGSMSDLIEGFDNHIRNAGEGHDRWEITDQDKLILPIIDSETGEEKKKIELTADEMDEHLKTCRKTIWILKIGTLIFLENNSAFASKLQRKKFYKVREIQDALEPYAENQLFCITQFELNDERSHLELGIKYTPAIVPIEEQVFFGGVEAYDIVRKVIKVGYEEQMVRIIHFILAHLDEEKLPSIKVKMFDEADNDMGTVEYAQIELAKVLADEEGKYIPIPSSGVRPVKECEMALPIRVPYGTKHLFEKEIENWQEEI